MTWHDIRHNISYKTKQNMTKYEENTVWNQSLWSTKKFSKPIFSWAELVMSDLHQNFGISSRPSTNMIYHVKDDPILQVSSQEPSMSSKSSTSPISIKSCLILIKISGYLSYHLRTWSWMSKTTLSFKSPVMNHQRHPSMTLRMGGFLRQFLSC